ncbi:hypothetical protein OG897_29455 [Streptomyces sp. NBC_00237]|uniref:hypothetical protein n=1 Tax=Streptomyces sp. NBC_00237 TaxID=2975687 RepID=UPI00224E5204|nr:hypothetical protein [Streptomyces sp. NBC_00237]MCX5205574.1 hypothetical protein [Streptomyces sp. NBC_00237]
MGLSASAAPLSTGAADPARESVVLAPPSPDDIRASAFREFRAEWQVLDGRVDLAGFLKEDGPATTAGIAEATVSVKVQFSDKTTRTCTARTHTGDGAFACEVAVADTADAPTPERATASWTGSRQFSGAHTTKDVEAVVPDAVEDGEASAM